MREIARVAIGPEGLVDVSATRRLAGKVGIHRRVQDPDKLVWDVIPQGMCRIRATSRPVEEVHVKGMVYLHPFTFRGFDWETVVLADWLDDYANLVFNRGTLTLSALAGGTSYLRSKLALDYARLAGDEEILAACKSLRAAQRSLI